MSLTPIWEEKLGNVLLRILTDKSGFKGGVIRKGQKPDLYFDPDLEALKTTLRREAGKSNRDYVGFDGARRFFLEHFPEGFEDPSFHGNRQHGERAYKMEAVDLLARTLPLEAARSASGAGEAALAAYRKTNLLASFEQMRVQDLLRSEDADVFIRLAARLADGDLAALPQMVPLLKRHDAAKWTVVTYLSFLWRPDAHMFLKPQVTQDFARRIGHPFAHTYRTALDQEVYESLLDLVATTRVEIAPLGPRDNIDVQSFIWVVGYYDAPEKEPA